MRLRGPRSRKTLTSVDFNDVEEGHRKIVSPRHEVFGWRMVANSSGMSPICEHAAAVLVSLWSRIHLVISSPTPSVFVLWTGGSWAKLKPLLRAADFDNNQTRTDLLSMAQVSLFTLRSPKNVTETLFSRDGRLISVVLPPMPKSLPGTIFPRGHLTLQLWQWNLTNPKTNALET